MTVINFFFFFKFPLHFKKKLFRLVNLQCCPHGSDFDLDNIVHRTIGRSITGSLELSEFSILVLKVFHCTNLEFTLRSTSKLLFSGSYSDP